MKKKVLFVAYGAGHIRTLLPIVKRITNDSSLSRKFTPIILALTTARLEVEKSGLPYIGFQDLETFNSLAREWGEKLADSLPANPNIPHSETVAYLGQSYMDLILEHGQAKADSLYAQKGRAAFFPLSTAKQALNDLKIDIVIATNSPRAEHAFLEAARQTKRKSLTIWSSLASHEIAWIGQPGFTDIVCVDSLYAQQKMLKAGRPIGEIALTGNPQFDDLLAYNQEEIAEFRKSKGWKPKDKILLFAQQNEPAIHPFTGEKGDIELPQKLNNIFFSSLKLTLSSVKLCIRYHPNQTPIPYTQHPQVSESNQSENLRILLHSVDAVFTCSSTVAYQAAILGKPIIQGMFSIFSKDVCFKEIANASEIYQFEEIPHIWEKITNDTLPKPNLFTKNKKNATHQIIEKLTNLSSNKQNE